MESVVADRGGYGKAAQIKQVHEIGVESEAAVELDRFSQHLATV